MPNYLTLLDIDLLPFLDNFMSLVLGNSYFERFIQIQSLFTFVFGHCNSRRKIRYFYNVRSRRKLCNRLPKILV